MRILLLLPIILYLGLVAFNRELLLDTQNVNLYALMQLDMPVIFYSTIFLVLYSVLLILIFDSINAFKAHKVRKLEKEIFSLKSKLYDEREDELVVFMVEQKRRLEDFLKSQEEIVAKIKSENETNLEKQKTSHEKILSKLNLLDEGVLEKIKKTFKSS